VGGRVFRDYIFITDDFTLGSPYFPLLYSDLNFIYAGTIPCKLSFKKGKGTWVLAPYTCNPSYLGSEIWREKSSQDPISTNSWV
jgi:hypothetical protein